MAGIGPLFRILFWSTTSRKQHDPSDSNVASFSDVIQLYNDEKDSILKTSLLTNSSVALSKLQLQNVQHVLHVLMKKLLQLWSWGNVTGQQTLWRQSWTGGKLLIFLAKGRTNRLLTHTVLPKWFNLPRHILRHFQENSLRAGKEACEMFYSWH